MRRAGAAEIALPCGVRGPLSERLFQSARTPAVRQGAAIPQEFRLCGRRPHRPGEPPKGKPCHRAMDSAACAPGKPLRPSPPIRRAHWRSRPYGHCHRAIASAASAPGIPAHPSRTMRRVRVAIAALRTLSRVAGSRGTAINGGVTSLANSSSQSQCLNAGRLPSQGKRQSMDSTIAKPAVNSRFHNSAFSIGHSCSCGHSIFSMILRIASRSPRLSLMLSTRVLSKGVREPPKLLSASSWSCWATKTSLATAAEKKWTPLAVRRR